MPATASCSRDGCGNFATERALYFSPKVAVTTFWDCVDMCIMYSGVADKPKNNPFLLN